jgi:hypothetical protein
LTLTSTPLAEGFPKRVMYLIFFFFLLSRVCLNGGIFRVIEVEVLEMRIGGSGIEEEEGKALE